MPGNIGLRDPRSYVAIMPLPIPSQKGLKIHARSPTFYNCWEPCRDEMFRTNYLRRQEQLSQQGYYAPNYKPYQELGHPLILEAKKLILHSLGQEDKETKPEKSDTEQETEGTRTDNSFETPQANRPLSRTSVCTSYRKHTNSFNKELQHTRQLITSVKHGRGYFYLLRKEEESKKSDILEKQRLHQEKARTEPQPPKDSGEENLVEDEGITNASENTRLFVTEVAEQQKKVKKMISRPFTPIHNSLLSNNVFNVDPESLFRQLCALHWLLESLTVEPFSAMGPVSSCWNIREPGGCKISIKRINREKEVEVKWQQFIMPVKAKKQNQKLLRNYLLPRKSSFLSVSRFSGLSSARTTTMGSVSSLNPSLDETPAGASGFSDAPRDSAEDTESTANSSFITQGKQSKEEGEEPLSDYMQSLLQMIAENVNKELDEEESQGKYKLIRSPSVVQVPSVREEQESKISTKRPKSSPAASISSTHTFIKEKSNKFAKMRDTFFEVANKADMNLHHKIEAIERRRQEFNIQKYLYLDTAGRFHEDLEKMRQAPNNVKEEKSHTDMQNWFAVLLSRITPELRKNQKIETILNKIEKLEEKQYIRLQPNDFLKVLDRFHTWELCSPDINVAIEFVREHLVQMPPEDYTAWFQERITLPQSRVQSAPPIR